MCVYIYIYIYIYVCVCVCVCVCLFVCLCVCLFRVQRKDASINCIRVIVSHFLLNKAITRSWLHSFSYIGRKNSYWLQRIDLTWCKNAVSFQLSINFA
jgi:hypothetical protein